jgi:hypothetical protein
MNDRYTRVTAPASFDGRATRRDRYFKTKNAAREISIPHQTLESRTKIAG